MSLRKLTDSIGVKASGVFIMALQSDILDGRYGSIESRYLAKCFSKVRYLVKQTKNVACSILTLLLQQS